MTISRLDAILRVGAVVLAAVALAMLLHPQRSDRSSASTVPAEVTSWLAATARRGWQLSPPRYRWPRDNARRTVLIALAVWFAVQAIVVWQDSRPRSSHRWRGRGRQRFHPVRGSDPGGPMEVNRVERDVDPRTTDRPVWCRRSAAGTAPIRPPELKDRLAVPRHRVWCVTLPATDRETMWLRIRGAGPAIDVMVDLIDPRGHWSRLYATVPRLSEGATTWLTTRD